MNLTLRPGTPADAERCGTICYEAFKAIADRHHFPPDFPSPQAAVASTERRFSHAGYYAVVAELEGRVVGSVFLDERSAIASVASRVPGGFAIGAIAVLTALFGVYRFGV